MGKSGGKLNFSGMTILGLNIALITVLLVTTDTFAQYDNIYSVLYGMSIQCIAIIGFAFLMILGEIDLSVGSMYGLSGIATALLHMYFGLPFYLSAIIVIFLCTLYGFAIGNLVARLRLNSMIVTLAGMSLIYGLSAILFSIAGPGTYSEVYRSVARFRILSIHWTIILIVIVVVACEIAMHKTTLIKKLFLTGSNIESARIYGIKSTKIKSAVFALSSFCAAFGGVVVASRITHSNLNTGQGLEVVFVTACVIGGIKFSGGRGSILGAALGLMFLAFLTNGMQIYRMNPLVQQVAVGIILILAVFTDVLMDNIRSKNKRTLQSSQKEVVS